VLIRAALADVINVPDDYATIQAALDAANAGDEIVVQPGTYVESIDLLGKAVTLRAVNLAVDLDDPLDPDEASIIDGDDAYYHIVTCVNGEGLDTIIDGFAIVDGMANGSGSDGQGGGLYIHAASPTVTRCYFTGNWAVTGGAIFTQDSNAEITDCIIKSNEASTGAGTANRGGAPTISDCEFTGNLAWFSGGGLDNVNSSPFVTGCTFSGNICGGGLAEGRGGGMYNGSNSPVIMGCTFSSNVAIGFQDYTGLGGGMCNYDTSQAAIIDCAFVKNSGYQGGGMYNWSASPQVTDCTFVRNLAEPYLYDTGAGVHNDGSSPIVTNCTFLGNGFEMANAAGGMFNENGSDPVLSNCLFAGNQGLEAGGVGNYSSAATIINSTFSGNRAGNIFAAGALWGSATVANSIFWGNTVDIQKEVGDVATVTYSNVQGGFTGTGNINIDPFFVRAPDPGSDAVWGTDDDDYGDLHLQDGSPCIDAADCTALPADVHDLDDDGDTDEPIPYDLDGNPRIADDPDTDDTGVGFPCVDMGAFEFQPINDCPGDTNGDDVVNVDDLFTVLGDWGQSDSPGDVNDDGIVNVDDLFVVLGHWGPC
jgi:hypothetical protein